MIRRHHTSRRMSQMVEYPLSGTAVILAGQVADDETLDVAGQTRQVLENINRLLGEAGTDRTRILSATIWLRDISDFAAMNGVWDAWVPDGQGLARACVEARLADPRLKVEIQVLALKP